MSKSNHAPNKVVVKLPLTFEEFMEQFACIDSDGSSIIQLPGIGTVKFNMSEEPSEENSMANLNHDEKMVKNDPTTLSAADVSRHFAELIHDAISEECLLAKRMLDIGLSSEFVLKSTYLNEDMVRSIQDDVVNEKRSEDASKILTPSSSDRIRTRCIINGMDKEFELAEQMLLNGASSEFVLKSTSLTEKLVNMIKEDIEDFVIQQIKFDTIEKAGIPNPLRNHFPAHTLSPVNKAIEIARKMLENGASKEVVLKVTSLSQAKIDALQNNFVN